MATRYYTEQCIRAGFNKKNLKSVEFSYRSWWGQPRCWKFHTLKKQFLNPYLRLVTVTRRQSRPQCRCAAHTHRWPLCFNQLINTRRPSHWYFNGDFIHQLVTNPHLLQFVSAGESSHCGVGNVQWEFMVSLTRRRRQHLHYDTPHY